MSLAQFFEKRHQKQTKKAGPSSGSNQLLDIFNKVPSVPMATFPKKQSSESSELPPKKKSKKSKIEQNPPQPQQKAQEKQLNDNPENLDATVFVGNVVLSCTHSKIKKEFEKYGKVEKVWFRSIPVQDSKLPKKASHILKKYQQGADTMNAYVRFSQQSEAQNACALNGSLFQQRNIRVSLCQDKQIDYTSTIFIGNLPYNVHDQELWDIFKPIGNIMNVRVIRKKGTLEGMGIAYIRFETKEQMKKAIDQMNGVQIKGRIMRIKKAVSKERIQKKFNNLKIKKDKKRGLVPKQTNNIPVKQKTDSTRPLKMTKGPMITKTKPINKKPSKFAQSSIVKAPRKTPQKTIL